MGLPDFNFFMAYCADYKYRYGIAALYIVGILGFVVSLPILHDPVLYNSMHYFLGQRLGW
jgi:hypothetical protein